MPDRHTFDDIARHFAPGWFGVVMGTGVLALTAHSLAGDLALLDSLAGGLHVANQVIFGGLALPWLWRWLRHRDAALATLRHPVQAHFYPTFSISLLMLANQYHVFGGPPALAVTLWWIGALLTWLFSFAILYHVFRGEHVALDHVTPGMYIPPVGLVVIPVAGGPLLAAQPEALRQAALVLDYLGFGAGIGMYIGFLGLTLFRFVLHKPVVGMLAPTVWIQLAPVGVIILSLLNMAGASPFAPGLAAAGGGELLQVLMLLLWGFGVWWLLMSLLLSAAARSRGEMPFALSWWALTFPLGAFVAASLRLGDLLHLGIVRGIGVAAWCLLLGLWSLTLLRTLRGVLSGAIFRPQH